MICYGAGLRCSRRDYLGIARLLAHHTSAALPGPAGILVSEFGIGQGGREDHLHDAQSSEVLPGGSAPAKG